MIDSQYKPVDKTILKEILQVIIRTTNKTSPNLILFSSQCQANINLFKVNNVNTIKRCGICSNITAKTPERRL